MTTKEAVQYLFCAINFFLYEYMKNDDFVTWKDIWQNFRNCGHLLILETLVAIIALLQSIIYSVTQRCKTSQPGMKGQLPNCLQEAFLLFYTPAAKRITWLFSRKLVPSPCSLADLMIPPFMQPPDHSLDVQGSRSLKILWVQNKHANTSDFGYMAYRGSRM